jgi:hypothetical protein
VSHILYAYGTLRPGKTEPIKINGTMHDLGWFPGVILGVGDYHAPARLRPGMYAGPQGDRTHDQWVEDAVKAYPPHPTFLAERIEIQTPDQFDRYEGYDPNDPDGSLYIRRPYEDGWIYEFNRHPPPDKVVQSGDWLAYKRERDGGK